MLPIAGWILRARSQGCRREWGAGIALLGVLVLSTSCFLAAEVDILPVPDHPHHAEELLLFRWMAKVAGVLLFAGAVIGALLIEGRRHRA